MQDQANESMEPDTQDNTENNDLSMIVDSEVEGDTMNTQDTAATEPSQVLGPSLSVSEVIQQSRWKVTQQR